MRVFRQAGSSTVGLPCWWLRSAKEPRRESLCSSFPTSLLAGAPLRSSGVRRTALSLVLGERRLASFKGGLIVWLGQVGELWSMSLSSTGCASESASASSAGEPPAQSGVVVAAVARNGSSSSGPSGDDDGSSGIQTT